MITLTFSDLRFWKFQILPHYNVEVYRTTATPEYQSILLNFENFLVL